VSSKPRKGRKKINAVCTRMMRVVTSYFKEIGTVQACSRGYGGVPGRGTHLIFFDALSSYFEHSRHRIHTEQDSNGTYLDRREMSGFSCPVSCPVSKKKKLNTPPRKPSFPYEYLFLTTCTSLFWFSCLNTHTNSRLSRLVKFVYKEESGRRA